ncbi:MAG: class I SAM-dependent methyltransferase [Pleurocapsa minor HA4230-MV1]|jgi:ubiquinone/menaquinone biosynthesis C-methylase UbiE|nr:class I SAM-dependent methyltransferase [Pleurocapsa minor HA4230-MV1]
MSNNNKQLYQLNPQSRFSDRAQDYAKYRPSYPSEAIDCILAGLDTSGIAADIGAGTGISSRLLADRGVKVIAIEPNAAMKQAAESHPLVEFGDGNAEATKLSDNSVDLVTCFQSFHWFNPEPVLQEFARILKPKGVLAVVWNNRDREDNFTREYSHLIQVASNNQSELRYGTQRFLHEPELFAPVRHEIFPYYQGLNREALIGRAMSTSYIPKQGEIATKFIQDLEQLYEQHKNSNGLVYLKYNTSIYLTFLLVSTT